MGVFCWRLLHRYPGDRLLLTSCRGSPLISLLLILVLSQPSHPFFSLIPLGQDGPDNKRLGRGTRIELVLKEDMAEFLEERKVC